MALQVDEVRHRLNERRSAEDSLQPLRDHIEQEKARFYTKHAREIEKLIRQRVEEGVKGRLQAIVRGILLFRLCHTEVESISVIPQLREKLGQYEDHIKTNNDLADKLKQAMAVT